MIIEVNLSKITPKENRASTGFEREMMNHLTYN